MPTPASTLARDALACVSLANLLAIDLWARILDPATSYYLHESRSATAYLATLVLVFGAAAAGTAAAWIARRSFTRTRMAFGVAFAAAAGVAIWLARREVNDAFGGGHDEVLAAITGTLAFALVAASLSPVRDTVRHGTLTALLVLSPFALVTSVQALRAALTPRTLEARPPAERFDAAAAADAPRVVVALFDELDELATFEQREPHVSLPAVDELAASSYHLTRARFPATRTELAIPSILTGDRVVGILDAGTSDRRLLFEDGRVELFSEIPTLFGDARAARRNAALAGWYHPYCRVLGDELVSCFARSNRQEMQRATLAYALARQGAAFVDALPHGKKLIRRSGLSTRNLLEIAPAWHEESLSLLHDRARALAADPSIDLVFAHYPIPHPPRIWDSAKDRPFRSNRRGKNAVGHNLELVDRAIAELVAAMKDGGTWDRTTVIVLADHPKRTAGLAAAPATGLPPGHARPIAFFVRLPGQPGVIDDVTRPNSMALRELVPALLGGEIRTNAELRAFLEAADARPSPSEKPDAAMVQR